MTWRRSDRTASEPVKESRSPLIPAQEPVKKSGEDTSFSARSSPRTRGPSLCPLKVRAIWQSLDSRVRGNERKWQFLHTLLHGEEREGTSPGNLLTSSQAEPGQAEPGQAETGQAETGQAETAAVNSHLSVTGCASSQPGSVS
jgi:hypothetical protein